MAIHLDGHAVFAAIGAHPAAFPDLSTDVAVAAEKLLVKQIKAKGLTLDGLRALFKAIGSDLATVLLDTLKDTDVAALVKKLDKNRAGLEPAPARALLHALGLGLSEPEADKPKPPTKSKPATKKKPIKGLMETTNAFEATRTRESAEKPVPAPKAAAKLPAEAPAAPAKPGGRGGRAKKA
ncbi:hypothetical protein [Roseixanthobacter glucoisosaccharinicivorans]|uniref:hypothetical protein n=1 Tax=Roseixanthobacter glucoisosaccharinicivorans TaxID=3119923 RepID=UPI003728E415